MDPNNPIHQPKDAVWAKSAEPKETSKSKSVESEVAKKTLQAPHAEGTKNEAENRIQDYLPVEFTVSDDKKQVSLKITERDKKVEITAKGKSSPLQKFDISSVTLTLPVKNAQGNQIDSVSVRVRISDLSKATGLSKTAILRAKVSKQPLKVMVLRQVLQNNNFALAQGLSLVEAKKVQQVAREQIQEETTKAIPIKSKKFTHVTTTESGDIYLRTTITIGAGGIKSVVGASELSGKAFVEAREKKSGDISEKTIAAIKELKESCQAQGIDTTHILIPKIARVQSGSETHTTCFLEKKAHEMWGVGIIDSSNPSPKTILNVLLGAAKGIDACHQAGFRHRDIKQENILVDYDQSKKATGYLHDLDFLVRASNNFIRGSEINIVGSIGFIPPDFRVKELKDEQKSAGEQFRQQDT